MLNFESKNSNEFLNLSHLDYPFSYKLRFLDNFKNNNSSIDLIETFNYIAGIEVKSIEKKFNQNIPYIFVKGKRNGKKTIIVWREKGNGFDPVKDKEFVEKRIIKEEYEEILVNGNSLIEEARSIDEIFKTNIK